MSIHWNTTQELKWIHFWHTINESQNKYAVWKDPDKKGVHNAWVNLCKILEDAHKSIVTESSSVVTWGQGEAEGRRRRDYQGAHGTFGCDIDIFITWIVVIVSEVYTHQSFFKLYSLLHVNYISMKLLKNDLKKKYNCN